MTWHPSGFVRLTGRDLADQKQSRLSRVEMTPFSERGTAVLLKGIAAVRSSPSGSLICNWSYRGQCGFKSEFFNSLG